MQNQTRYYISAMDCPTEEALLRGKLGGGLFAERFTAEGELDWLQPAKP